MATNGYDQLRRIANLESSLLEQISKTEEARYQLATAQRDLAAAQAEAAWLTDARVTEYAKQIGAYEIWRCWYSNMMRQGREVAENRSSWQTLPDQDKELDRQLAEDFLFSFLNWLNAVSPTALTAQTHGTEGE